VHAPGSATAALYLVPPVALAVSFVWLGEAPSPIELLGGGVGVLGVVLINRARNRTRTSAPPAAEPRELEAASSSLRN
jgi:drug/metabolite transporter (DMT)-like permease